MATDQDLTDVAARLFQALPGASWLETRIGTRPWLLAFCAERGVACFEPLQSGEPVEDFNG